MNDGNVSFAGDVDWVTATTQNSRTGHYWMSLFHQHRNEYPGETRKWKAHGFAGLQHEKLIWAQRESDGRFMIVAQSDAAGEYWVKLRTSGTKVTRVDLAVDCWLPEEKPGLAGEAYEKLRQTDGDNKRLGYSYITNTRHGETLYVGSRTSQQFGRLYDKGIQQGSCPPGQWFRYEVEFKRPMADEVYGWLNDKIDNKTLVGCWIAGAVRQWFCARDVEPVYDSDQADLHLIRPVAAVTSTERKLIWLQDQVKPTVAKLFQLGLGERAIVALGLDSCLEPKQLERLQKRAAAFAREGQPE